MKPYAIALLAFALALPASAGPGAQNTLSETERAAGWRLLFDGSTLNGWRSLSRPEPGAGWAVRDGAIVRTARSGDLLTKDQYGDFELSIEWKVADETNSGILYRVSTSGEQTYFTGPEYQILDNVRGADRVNPKHRAAALYDLVAPPADYTRPVGEWNQTRILVRGWKIEHWLNGHKVVDVDLASAAGRDLVRHSKFNAMPNFIAFARGHIALQDHDGEVSYRNIALRDLPAEP